MREHLCQISKQSKEKEGTGALKRSGETKRASEAAPEPLQSFHPFRFETTVVSIDWNDE